MRIGIVLPNPVPGTHGDTLYESLIALAAAAAVTARISAPDHA